MTRFFTEVAYDCIVVLVQLVAVVIPVVQGVMMRPIVAILVLSISATVSVYLQVVKYRHLHICWQKPTLMIWVVVVVLFVFGLLVSVAWKACFNHSFQAG